MEGSNMSAFLPALLAAKLKQPGWNDERVDLLRKLWAQGLSASQIAAQLGWVSRNSAIGKVRRLGLAGRAKDTSRLKRERGSNLMAGFDEARAKRVRKPRSAPSQPWRQPPPELTQPASAVPAQPVEASMAIPDEQKVTLMQLTSQTCRWPLWGADRREGLYCGAATVPGQPYCCGHCALSFNQTERQRQRAA
jgi:GcrA cell cycle regulator